MYPMLKEGVSLGTFRYVGSEKIHYYAENEDGCEFEISRAVYCALINADGTAPLRLPKNGRNIIPRLKQNKLIRTSRFVRDKGIINRFIIFPVSNELSKWSKVWKSINAVLPVISIATFITAVLLRIKSEFPIGHDFNQSFYYLMLLFSLALHEIGHLISGLAYNYKISDTGILLLGIFPIGAYIAHSEKNDATREEKIQFSLAGVEMNLLLASVFLLFSLVSSSLSMTMVSIANVNVVLAGINLLPVSGLDGEQALSALFEVSSISAFAKKCLKNKKQRRQLFRSGITGYACLPIFGFVVLSQYAFLLLLILDLASIIYLLV